MVFAPIQGQSGKQVGDLIIPKSNLPDNGDPSQPEQSVANVPSEHQASSYRIPTGPSRSMYLTSGCFLSFSTATGLKLAE